MNYLGDKMYMDVVERKLNKIGFKSPYFVSKNLGCPSDYWEIQGQYTN